MFMTMLSGPPEQHAAADQHVADAQYYRRVLHDLIDMGADLARMVHAQAHALGVANAKAADVAASSNDNTARPGAEPDATIAFDRIARSIRRSITLARSLDEPPPAKLAPTPGGDNLHRIAARKLIIRGVEDAIQRHTGDGEPLYAELRERLDEPDLDDDLTLRPTADIIADICRDLGIAAPPGTQPWRRRTPADIAALRTRAAMPYAAAADPSPGQMGATLLLHNARFRGK